MPAIPAARGRSAGIDDGVRTTRTDSRVEVGDDGCESDDEELYGLAAGCPLRATCQRAKAHTTSIRTFWGSSGSSVGWGQSTLEPSFESLSRDATRSPNSMRASLGSRQLPLVGRVAHDALGIHNQAPRAMLMVGEKIDLRAATAGGRGGLHLRLVVDMLLVGLGGRHGGWKWATRDGRGMPARFI